METAPLLEGESRTRAYSTNSIQDYDVFNLIHLIQHDLLNIIGRPSLSHNIFSPPFGLDRPLSEEELRGSLVRSSIIKPLVKDYSQTNPATIFSLLVNRLHFLRLQSSALSLYSINATRASVCEILAVEILDGFRDHGQDQADQTLLSLATFLVKCYSPFKGALPHVIPKGLSDISQTSALEIAIVTNAKYFIRCPAVQEVVAGIYRGQIVYSPTSFLDIIPDHFKRKEISLYKPADAPLLDHYRLKVPAYRRTLETIYFLVLFVSYFIVQQERRHRPYEHHVKGAEIWFIVYTLGLSLDKIASILEHGWTVFTANMWNGLDIAFCLSFFVYLGCVITGEAETGHAILACAAVLLFPRLAFDVLSNNVLVLSLRAMFQDFAFLMALAAWCFLGFVFALHTMAQGAFSVYDISKWMIWIWFGLDATGIELSPQMHPFFGPFLMIAYACLSTTLLLTVLVSILGARFAELNSHATEEYLFRQAVVIFEGIKSDAIFDYWPPMNMLAVAILLPIRFFTTKKKFHSIRVLCTRIVAFPILLVIAVADRRFLIQPPRKAPASSLSGQTRVDRGVWFEARADVEAVLEHMSAVNSPSVSSTFTPRRQRHFSVSSMHGLEDTNHLSTRPSAEMQKEIIRRLEDLQSAVNVIERRS